MARTTSRHRCSPSRPCNTNRKVAAIFQQYYSGGVKQYAPLDFPEGLRAYYNVLDEPTIYTNDDPVNLITDLSGNDENMIVVSDPLRPLWSTDFGDGYPSLDFDGTKTMNPTSGKTYWDFMHTGPSTSMWLVRSTVDNATHYLFSSMVYGNNANGRADVFRQFSSGQNGSFEIRMRGDSTTVYNAVAPQEKTPKNIWLLIWIVISETELNMYVNGIVVLTQQIVSSFKSTTSNDNPRFFSNITTESNRFNGNYRASAFWNRALPVEDIAKMQGGLNYGS